MSTAVTSPLSVVSKSDINTTPFCNHWIENKLIYILHCKTIHYYFYSTLTTCREHVLHVGEAHRQSIVHFGPTTHRIWFNSRVEKKTTRQNKGTLSFIKIVKEKQETHAKNTHNNDTDTWNRSFRVTMLPHIPYKKNRLRSFLLHCCMMHCFGSSFCTSTSGACMRSIHELQVWRVNIFSWQFRQSISKTSTRAARHGKQSNQRLGHRSS